MITPPSANNNDSHNYAHGSTHSPHTAPDPMVQAQPEYSQQHSICSPSSTYQHLDSSSSSTATNSPHTAVLQYDSPNPNPQLGHVHLDFIPLPTTRPSAPPQPSIAPLPYVAPPSPAPSPASVPYPVPPSTNSQQQRPQHENVTFVDATSIDMNNEKYKMSAAAGGSTFIQDLRNPKKKAFWIFNIIALAIIFGVLGATVWKPNSNNKDDPSTNGDRKEGTPTTFPSVTKSPAPSNPVVPTPVTVPVVPTPVTVPVVPTPVIVPTSNPAPPPQSTGGGSKQDIWYACRKVCTAAKDKCDANCRATDSAYQSCNDGCKNGGDSFCEWNCRISNGCFRGCSNTQGSCASECPSPRKRK